MYPWRLHDFSPSTFIPIVETKDSGGRELSQASAGVSMSSFEEAQVKLACSLGNRKEMQDKFT